MTKHVKVAPSVFQLLLDGRDKEATALARAYADLAELRFECPECSDIETKECNGDAYRCIQCDWTDSSDLGPIEVRSEGYTFDLQ